MKHVSALWFLAFPCAFATPPAAQQGRVAVAEEKLETSSWFKQVSEELLRGEYRFAPVQGEAGVWAAPSRAQGFHSRVSAGGIEVVPRDAGDKKDQAWKLALATKSFGRAGQAQALAPASVQVTNERVELDHGGLVEWLVNEERGLEQGWTIANAPFGVEPLWIGLEVGGDLGLRIDEGGRSGRFVDATGEVRLRYAGLMAFDATGRELVARLAPSPEGVGISIDDRGALYPVIVDPVLTGPTWTAEGNAVSAWFGTSVATAGDVNGDGYSDVIVGSPFSPGFGRAHLYLGSGAGLSTSPAWTVINSQFSSSFGSSVASAGDVNGDGYSDVIVGAYEYDNGQSNEGRAYLYLGSATGLSTSAAWTAESNQIDASFGVSVATAGDVNADGYSDVLVGAMRYSNGHAEEGRAYLYLGSGAGLSASAAWTAESDQGGAWFGRSVAMAGDVNGDGYGDVIVGSNQYDNGESDEGRAYLYLGSGAGLSASAAWTAESDQAFAYFGTSVAAAGDVNGDGYGDVIVGAIEYDNGQSNEGRAYLYLGSAAGLATGAAWTAESDQSSASFGLSVATAGDVNGDGYGDVIVGAQLYNNPSLDEGRAYLYLGAAAGLSVSVAWTAESDQAGAQFGSSVATAGDVNGDGYSDVLVGAPFYNNPENDEGRAYLYLGSAAVLATGTAWNAESDQDGAFLGLSVATAGDVNGDGYGDVIVGAPNYTNGEAAEGRAYLYLGSSAGLATSAAWSAESDQAGALLGNSAATAGDVNGDGFSDVIVAAPSYDNGEADEGRVFVYLGSGSGLSASAAWSAESDQVNAFFGGSVATAGDVNGDGYSDVIVGAYTYDDGEADEGRTFVYLGSSAGLTTSAAWTAESDQASAFFGGSVATAGDVNGDGYSDVIVGAYQYSNGESFEGRAFVYLGSSVGLATSATWTAESDQAGANFGLCVATAGDVNGDGYSEVIVGAPYGDNGEMDEGRVFVYLGSGAGLAASAAWTAESDQISAVFGRAVSSAGDVNADGYGDVSVGAVLYDNGQAEEGRVFLYLGSGSGLASGAAWTAESDQASAQFGISVAPGDVNGDGYGDLIVGSVFHDNGQSNEGRAFLYLGNEGRGGRVLAPQQRRAFSPQPIAALGRSDVSAFRIQVEHPALAGGGRAFLEWEVKPLGIAFDGQGLGRSALGQPVDPFSPSSFDETALPGSSALLPYKWRARVALEGNLFFPSTAWFGIPDNARTETDLRFSKRRLKAAKLN